MCGMCRSVTMTSTAVPLRSRSNASSALWHARTRNPSFSIHATVRRNCNASSLITITVGGMAVCITGSPMQAAAVLRPLLYIGNMGENFTGEPNALLVERQGLQAMWAVQVTGAYPPPETGEGQGGSTDQVGRCNIPLL